MTFPQFKTYSWILLVPIVVVLVLAAIDKWQWHGVSDSNIFQQIFETLPRSTNSGRKLAVISDIDEDLWRLMRGYAGISPEDEYILEPENLPHLAKMLLILARAKPVARLTFFGVGKLPKGNKVTLQFTKQQPEIGRNDFEKLREDYPDLPSAFSPGAQVVLFNCWAGRDQKLLRAIAEAFLRYKGGVVIANPELTKFKISSGGMFWSKKYAIITWIDRPNEIRWVQHEVQAQRGKTLF